MSNHNSKGHQPASQPPQTATAPAAQSSLTPEMVKILQEGIAMGVAMAAQQQKPAAPAGKSVYDTGGECQWCHQRAKACGGGENPEENHALVAVATSVPQFMRGFRGVCLNGVWYLSNDRTHRIWVPKAGLGDILSTLAKFEEAEAINKFGKAPQVHHSGSLSNFRPAVSLE